MVPVSIDFGKLDYMLKQPGKGYVSCSAIALVLLVSPEGGNRLARVAASAAIRVALCPTEPQNWQLG